MQSKKQNLIESLRAKRDAMLKTGLSSERQRLRVMSNVLSNRLNVAVKSKSWGKIEDKPGELWADSTDSVPFIENVQDVGDVIRLGHTGWYTDDFQDNLCVGIVGQMRVKGVGLVYVRGYRFSEWEGVQWDLRHQFKARSEAARMADKWAEQIAEVEREYAEQFQQELEATERAAYLDQCRIELDSLQFDYKTLAALPDAVKSLILKRVKFLSEELNK